MPKLNKSEKEYAVSRIYSELEKAIFRAYPTVDNVISEEFLKYDSLHNGTFRIKTRAELIELVSKNASSRWSSIKTSDLVSLSQTDTKTLAAYKANNAARDALRTKLALKAQPFIDEIQLGQADASRLSEISLILKGK